MAACKNSGISMKDCFTDISKPIISGKGKEEFIEDYKLTRYACYLIAQNGDSRKNYCSCSDIFCSSNQKTRNKRKRI